MEATSLDAAHMALLAQKDANDAKHTAEKALMTQAAHEQICAERYANINRQLSEASTTQKEASQAVTNAVEKIYVALDGLKATANKAGGADVTIRYACLVIGAAGVIYGISK